MPTKDRIAYHSTHEKVPALTLGTVEGAEQALRFRNALLLTGTEAGADFQRKAVVTRAHRYGALSLFVYDWASPKEIAEWALLGKWGELPEGDAIRELSAAIGHQRADGGGPLLPTEQKLVWSEARRRITNGDIRAPHRGRGVVYTVSLTDVPADGLLDLDLPLAQQKPLAAALKGKYRFAGTESGREVMARISVFLPDAEGGSAGGAARVAHNGYGDQAATFLGKLGFVGLRYTPRHHGTEFPATASTFAGERLRDWRGDAVAQAWIRPAVAPRPDALAKDIILFDATLVNVVSERAESV